MKGKRLFVLTIIAIVLCLLAYMSSKKSRQRGTEVSSVMGKPLVEAIQETETLNSIESITFKSAASTVSVARVDGVWVAPEKFNYPAEFSRIRDFLRKLQDLKVGQLLSGDDSQKSRLELLPPEEGSPGSTGTLIEIRDGAGATIASLVAGKEHTRSMPADAPPSPYGMRGGYPDGRYVSCDGRSCLISDTLSDIPSNVKEWLKTQIANVSSADTQEIMITDGDKSLTLRRQDGGTLTLSGLAEDEEMDTSKVNSLGNMLSYLTFEDVADPSASDSALGFDNPVTYSARNKKDQVFTLIAGGSPEGSSDRYVRLSASYIPPKDEPDEATGEEAEIKKPDDTEPDTEALEAEAKKAEEAARKKKEEQDKRSLEIKEFNSSVKGWTYLVAAHKLDPLATDRSAFVKEKEKESESKEEE